MAQYQWNGQTQVECDIPTGLQENPNQSRCFHLEKAQQKWWFEQSMGKMRKGKRCEVYQKGRECLLHEVRS